MNLVRAAPAYDAVMADIRRRQDERRLQESRAEQHSGHGGGWLLLLLLAAAILSRRIRKGLGIVVIVLGAIALLAWAVAAIGRNPDAAAILTGLATTPFLIFLFIVLYLLSAPIWLCFIAPASVGLALSIMYKSAKRTRLKRNG
jgi:hypothetical protein